MHQKQLAVMMEGYLLPRRRIINMLEQSTEQSLDLQFPIQVSHSSGLKNLDRKVRTSGADLMNGRSQKP